MSKLYFCTSKFCQIVLARSVVLFMLWNTFLQINKQKCEITFALKQSSNLQFSWLLFLGPFSNIYHKFFICSVTWILSLAEICSPSFQRYCNRLVLLRSRFIAKIQVQWQLPRHSPIHHLDTIWCSAFLHTETRMYSHTFNTMNEYAFMKNLCDLRRG